MSATHSSPPVCSVEGCGQPAYDLGSGICGECTEDRLIADILAKIEQSRDFPRNTCPASRHVQMIGTALAKQEPYPMLEEEPRHVALSVLSVVDSLYRARRRVEEMTRALEAAKEYRAAEQDGTPRLMRGKKLHDLGTALDNALAALASGET